MKWTVDNILFKMEIMYVGTECEKGLDSNNSHFNI